MKSTSVLTSVWIINYRIYGLFLAADSIVRKFLYGHFWHVRRTPFLAKFAVQAMRQNYHLYIHKVLAQQSLQVEAQPSPVDFKREFS